VQEAREPTSEFLLDRAVRGLQKRAQTWLDLGIEDRIVYLKEVGRRTAETAPALVAEAVAAKGVDVRYGGEDWVAGPITQLRLIRFLIGTLEGIRRRGRVPVPRHRISTRPDGQVVVRVTPADVYDRVMYRGITADVWLDPSVDRRHVDEHMGSFYTKPELARPLVSLVLGAGNVSSIGPLDVVHQLFVEGRVALLKFNPINDYIGPYTERNFASLMADGFVRTAYGGAEVGRYLVHHPGVDVVHVTGAAGTHDAIVFGEGEEGAARRSRNEPLLSKPITSELGNVSPVIVVPGVWSERDLRFRAEDVATQMTQNAGFNCNAAKVLVIASGWPQREAFLDELRRVLRSLPPRPAYYPGAEERFERFVTSHENVEMLGERKPGVLPPTLLVGVDPHFEHLAFSEEAFCPIAAVTSLPAEGPAEFLERAVAFCNADLTGTLNATILIDPKTEKSVAVALDNALAALRYGSVAVNVWAAAGFVLGNNPWGAFPGHTLDDVGSGIGFVRNARLFDHPQKTVIRAPFRQFPKPAWFVTHRNAHRTLARVADLEAAPRLSKIPLLGLSTLRG
jgi:acyl-CoA reductase-like NAD-dependent aldehyde dehydrogenase